MNKELICKPIPNVINVDDIQEILETNKLLQKEINKLNNIINELEKYINNQDYWLCEFGYKEFTPYMPVKKLLDKLKELKEDK